LSEQGKEERGEKTHAGVRATKQVLTTPLSVVVVGPSPAASSSPSPSSSWETGASRKSSTIHAQAHAT
jgi:hypothetical protein